MRAGKGNQGTSVGKPNLAKGSSVASGTPKANRTLSGASVKKRR